MPAFRTIFATAGVMIGVIVGLVAGECLHEEASASSKAIERMKTFISERA